MMPRVRCATPAVRPLAVRAACPSLAANGSVAIWARPGEMSGVVGTHQILLRTAITATWSARSSAGKISLSGPRSL